MATNEYMQRMQSYARENRMRAVDSHAAAPSPAPAASASVDFFKSGPKDPTKEKAKHDALMKKLRERGD